MIDNIVQALTPALGTGLRLEPLRVAGFTAARKFRGVRPDGTTVFVKYATTAYARQQLAREALAYQHLRVDAMLRLVAHVPDAALLVLEDAGEAYWPPPWRPDDLDGVVAALHDVHRHELPAGIPPEDFGPQLRGGWTMVAAEPAPFLRLKLCDAPALRRMLPALIEVDQANDVRGSSVSHLDLRSDNICRATDGWRFVDWSFVTCAAPALDFVLWLPSLLTEVDDVPEALMAYGHHAFMVSFAGYLAARAGLPEPPGTSGNVRDIQRRQLRVAFRLARAVVGVEK